MRRHFLFLFLLFSLSVQAQGELEWSKEFQKLEQQYHYGNYFSCQNTGKGLLRKMNKKGIYPDFILPTQALLLKYKVATGLRLGNDTLLDEIIFTWRNSFEAMPDSTIIMGNLAIASTAFQFNKYRESEYFLNEAEKRININTDPYRYWLQKIRITKIELYIKSMMYTKALKLINPAILYQKNIANRTVTQFDTASGKEITNNIKKKEYKERLNTLGLLKVMNAEIYKGQGNHNQADTIYRKNIASFETWFSKKDESFTLNQFGYTQLKVLQGNFEIGNEFRKIRNKYAQNIKFNIPNIQYNYMFEQEIISYLEILNFSKLTKALQQHQREVIKNYPKKSVYQFKVKHLTQLSNFHKGKYQSYAKHTNKQALNLPRFFGPNDADQLSFLYDLALAQERVYDFENVEKTLIKALDITNSNNELSSPLVSKANLELGSFYANFTTNLNTADSIFTTYYDKFVVKELHPYHPLFSRFLADYALLDKRRDLFIESLEKYAQLTSISKNKYGPLSEQYAIVLEKKAQVEMDLGYYPYAEKDLLKSALAFKSAKQTKSINYVYTLQSLGEIHGINGDFPNAKRKLFEAYELAKKFSAINEMLLVDIDESWAKLFIELSKYDLAEEKLLETKYKKTLNYGGTNVNLIQTYRLLGELYTHQGRIIEAEKAINKATQISKENFGSNSLEYYISKVLLIEVYHQIGDIERAINLSNEMITAFQNKLGPNYLGIAGVIIQKTRMQLELGYPTGPLLKSLNTASFIITSNVNDYHPKNAEVIELKALISLKNGKTKDALIQLQAANLIFKSSFGADHPKTADNQVNIATLYFETGNYDNALIFYNEALKIYLHIFDTHHPKYIYTLSKIGWTHFAQKEYAEAANILRTTTKMYLIFIEDIFPYLSDSEKAKYWSKIQNDFKVFDALVLEHFNQDPSLLADMYNNRLATKNLLLKSTLKIKQDIQTYGTPEDISLLHFLHQQQDSLNWAQSFSTQQLDSINVNVQLFKENIILTEKTLSERSQKISSNQQHYSPTWQDVRSNLKDNESAIEIIRVQHFDKSLTDSIVYVGLILTKNAKTPIIVALENGNDLEGKYYNYYQNSIKQKIKDTKSYGRFWEYFDAHLRKSNTIYVSADGVFKQINPETFIDNSSQYLLFRYTFYNLSNTVDILKPRSRYVYTSKSIILFGNPTFNTNSNTVSTSLPGAEKEVKEIATFFKTHNWSVEVYTGMNATEGQIKQIQSPRVLHLATHGFFMKNTVDTSSSNVFIDSFHPKNEMLRSGLLFAGADSLLILDNLNTINKSDGVLTAKEAMNLHLEHTELVFLSACETGRENIKSSNGVYGLQQAFIVAGAQNVIMTLFKVDDKITQELAQTFYTIWKKNGNKRMAFINAKKAILQKYKYPIYWGAFVLIGLD